MPATLRRDNDKLTLSLSGMDRAAFADALMKVKRISGWNWNPDDKLWEWPADEQTASKIAHSIGPQVDASVAAWLRGAAAKVAEELTTQLPLDAELRYPMADLLYPHQRAAVDFVMAHPHILIADEMGLGKTIEAIVSTIEYGIRNTWSHFDPRIVVSPNSMLGTWAEEIGIWDGGAVVVLDGKTPKKRNAQFDELGALENGWGVVNWEKIGRVEAVVEFLARLPKSAVVADEAHRAKNREAAQTLGLGRLQAPMQLALTGTPIMNSPDEVWSILRWLRPDLYQARSRSKITYWQFFHQYVESYEAEYGRVITGVRNPDGLRHELSDKMVRRTKRLLVEAGVIPPKLPPQYIRVPLKPKQRRLYNEAATALLLDVQKAMEEKGPSAPSVKALLQAVKDGDMARQSAALQLLIPNGAARIMRLRQIASSPALLGGDDESGKLDALIERIKDADPNKPFVVFSWFKGTAELVVERLAKHKITAEAITGDVPAEERTEVVRRLQEGDTRVIAATISAGGTGLTMTAADTAFFVERDWVPAVNAQAEDRLHRIGQKSAVNIVILEAEDTVDTNNVAPANALKEMVVGFTLGVDARPEA